MTERSFPLIKTVEVLDGNVAYNNKGDLVCGYHSSLLVLKDPEDRRKVKIDAM